MLLRKYWIPLLVFIVAIVGVGLYYLQTRPAKPPILIVKPVEYEKPAAKAPVGEPPEQVGHVHEDGTFHADTPAPVATPPRTGPLTYHADLLASNPVEALRAQTEERGHWSARWIPPFPPDDHEAQTFARNAYLSTYHDEGTPEFERSVAAYLEQLREINVKYPIDGARNADLSKIVWTGVRNVVDHYDPKTGYAIIPSDYFPDHISDLR